MTFCKSSGLHKPTTGCDCEHCKPDARDQVFVAGNRSGKTAAFIKQAYRKFLRSDD